MSGTPANARLWEDANVYVSFDLAATNPANADAAFSADWDLVGLLDGGQGFQEEISEDVEDYFAWGQRLLRTRRRNFKLTRAFTAYEYNETTQRLLWPGSSGSTIVVPRPERVKIAFETIDGDITNRLISYYQAEIVRNGTMTEGEEAPTTIPFLATIYPDGDGNLLVRQTNGTVSW